MEDVRLEIVGPHRPEAHPHASGLLAWQAVVFQATAEESSMPPTVCVFNGTRECFLCLCAVAAIVPATPLDQAGVRAQCSRLRQEDGIWRKPYPAVYTVGPLLPVDQVYVDQGNRVIQVIEHLHPLELVSVRRECASVIETRTGAIFASRTQVGDQLLICCPEEVEAHWKEIQGRTAWMKKR
jgi:uncharacterized protein